MSHLRAPAARADRREGGRHGRPGGRTATALPETHIRPHLLRIAVLPAVAVGLSACAAVLFTLRTTGARPGPALLAVLTAAALVALTGIGVAAVAADRAARSVRDRVGTLRRAAVQGQSELRGVVERLRRGDEPPVRGTPPRDRPDGDEFDQLAVELTRAQDVAVDAVVQAAQLSSQAGSEQKVEVFVNLARRLQSLVHREICLLDELENDVEDPELLKGLFHVDHLATRIRRHAENLAVLGGAVSRRQWTSPVPMTEVMRSATAEVEQYSRVKLVPPIAGTLSGHAVADVIHLLAELIENATVFSAPHTQVLLRANLVTAGLAVEVEDRGLGMPLAEQNRMNRLLADPDQVNVASLLQDGRIGLFVVAALARRHGVAVRLQGNIYGGVQAVLILPQELLGAEPRDEPAASDVQQHAQGAVRHGQDVVPHAPDVRGTGGALPQAHPGPEPRQEPVPVPVQPQRDTAPDRAGGQPRPLPVRGARQDRPTPADAVPGIRPEDRQAAAEHAAAPLTPLGGAVGGRADRPQLPKRRAQEHIVPQLRDSPGPRPDGDQLVGHDPGLMAAFQRGIGLAQAQEARDPTPREYGTGGLPDSGLQASSLQDGGFQNYGFPRDGSGQGG
ncbi:MULTISPECIES: ATP-binding protein [Streptomyces]|uniref:ATP-binding protein n=1 Tax=Streptomyces TaxID=1883 RepID=UPI001E3817DE|nr:MULTISPECIES: ATP-binding protein [Streptomyces]UFQ19383.1 ATP-binding protein [Streptomyces huasconensis]WCL89004.1 ATP-binding protein [Streptomyces sp. JCM 35825]